MIVNSMTPSEAYKELDLDMERLVSWWMWRRKELTRLALKLHKFPHTTWFEYTSARKNRYLVLSIILGRKYETSALSMLCALQVTDHGITVYAYYWPWQDMPRKMIFRPHMFKRYAERLNVEATGIELIMHYLQRNGHGQSLDGSRFSGRSVRYKNRTNLCISVSEGVLLGELIEDVFVARTFITYEMATGLQREVFEAAEARVLTPQQMLDEIKQKRNRELPRS